MYFLRWIFVAHSRYLQYSGWDPLCVFWCKIWDLNKIFCLSQFVYCGKFDIAENDKEKLFEDVDSGGVSGMGPSAALTPAIWEKTIPYDSETFHLEYMDLEEFLMENGINATEDEGQQKSLGKENLELTTEKPSSTSTSESAPAISLMPVMELDQCEEEVVTITTSSSSSTDTKSGQQTETEHSVLSVTTH